MGGSGGDDHSASLFRVGDNVELLRVIGMMSILVVCVMVLERLIHSLEHKLVKYPKYHEMMTKVFGELMILGFIGLGIKLLKEMCNFNAYSKRMIAFQAADLTIFMVAIALVFQAAVVFLRVRRKNIQSVKAELITTQHLIDHIARTGLPTWYHELAGVFTYARPQNLKRLGKSDIPEVVQLRILRHKFLKSYGLPEVFPFSKYLRQAQDNQISHMIDLEIKTWLALLLMAWKMETVAKIIEYEYDTKYAFVVSFVIFSWLSVLLHIGAILYLNWAVSKLVNKTVDAPSSDANHRYQYLHEIAESEIQAADHELAHDAIATMESVREREQLKRQQMELLEQQQPKHPLLSRLTKCCRRSHATTSTAAEEAGISAETVAAQAPPIQLKWFSRKKWHSAVMSAFMVAGLFVALFLQCVVYQMRAIHTDYGLVVALLIPLPLILNIFIFHPRILRNFILVSSIVELDDTALGDVIDHFTETIQLRASFVETVHAYLSSTNQTIADIQNEFEARDVAKTGHLNPEQVRLVLRRFGFQLSYFRFNSVAKLLFDFHGIHIKYAHVIRLLAVGASDDVRALTNATSFLDESSSFDSPHGASASTVETAKPRNKKPLLRTKSSAANSLYRMYVDEPTPLARPNAPPGSPQDENHTPFVRM